MFPCPFYKVKMAMDIYMWLEVQNSHLNRRSQQDNADFTGQVSMCIEVNPTIWVREQKTNIRGSEFPLHFPNLPPLSSSLG